jgi:hypothetical protein
MQALTLLIRMAYCRSRAVTSADIRQASWRKSSFSQMNGNCLELSRLRPDGIGIRDTKDNGNGPLLIFTDAEFDAFLAGAKEGQFDNL